MVRTICFLDLGKFVPFLVGGDFCSGASQTLSASAAKYSRAPGRLASSRPALGFTASSPAFNGFVKQDLEG
jgi:hypothetical protein